MEILQAGIMGIVQGLTEFLPVSSSGHLALFNLLLPEAGGSIDFTFLLHVATLLATFIYFRKDIGNMLISILPKNKEMKKERRMLGYLLLATAITGPIGLVMEPKLDAFSSNLLVLGFAYLGTTILLSAAEYFTASKASRTAEDAGVARSAFIGLAQGVAVVPGLSRSGTTIAAGMAMGLSRGEAARFSFLLVIPIILAGALKDSIGLINGELLLPSLLACIVGFITAAVSGYLAIAFMIEVVKKIKLYWFAAYTAILGCVLLGIYFLA